jgi:pimeloyl-ACP methyl ester carboxylesterase
MIIDNTVSQEAMMDFCNTGETQEERKCFILVHGTWAANATWILSDSQFAQGLSRQFNCTIRPFRWSGKNSELARREAASQLVQLISEIHNDAPKSQIVLIGHSHGGTVALHAAADIPGRNLVSEVVCLGTPLFVYSARDSRPAAWVIAAGLILFICIGIISWWFGRAWAAAIPPIFAADFHDRVDEVTGLPEFNEDQYFAFFTTLMRLVAGIAVVGALTSLLFLLATPTSIIIRWILTLLQRKWMERHSPIQYPCRTLILYTRRDEAFTYLWLMQSAWRPIFIAISAFGRVGAKLVILMIPSVLITSYLGVVRVDSTDPFGSIPLILSLSVPLVAIYGLTSIAFIFCLLAAVYGSLVAGTRFGFGSAGLISYQLINVTPQQATDTEHVDTIELKLRTTRGLRHSQFYLQEDVGLRIAAWLKRPAGSSSEVRVSTRREKSLSRSSRRLSSLQEWIFAFGLLLILLGLSRLCC